MKKFEKGMLPKEYPKKISEYVDLREVDFSEANVKGLDFSPCILTDTQVKEIKARGGYVAGALAA